MGRRRLGLAAAAAAGLVLLCAPAADAAIYWHTRFDKIGRADNDGGGANPSFITGASYAGVASNGTYVFWGNSNSVGRASVAGTDVNQSFAPSDPGCGVLAVAANASEAFFLESCASPSIRRIMRFPVGGGTPQPVVASGPSAGACGIAIDSTYLYWSDLDKIGRVPLSGGGPPEPTWLDLDPPTGTQICGLAVDSQHVYFTLSLTHDPPGDTAVGRVNADGSGTPNYAFITGTSFYGGSANPSGVAVFAGHVYWGNQTTGFTNSSIGRANTDGSGVDQAFISPVTFPQGVAVDGVGSGADADGDAVPDATDNCGAVPNPDQLNTDGDGQGDVCDSDDDNDSRADGTDNCPTEPNAGQEDLDGDGPGDACDSDDDSDGVGDSGDNCPRLANPDQRDDDQDGVGRACDASDVAPPPPPMRIVFVDTSHRSFAPGSSSTPLRGRAAARAPRGTVFSFRLADPGTVKIAIQRAMPGRRSGGRCRKPSRRLRKKRACTRWVTQHALVREANAGLNKVSYTGRVRGKALRPGRHRAVFTATAPGFSPSAAATVKFRIVRR